MIKSTKNLPQARRRGGPTSRYTWVLADMAVLQKDEYIEVEVPEGKTFRTMRNCVVKQLVRGAPKPPRGMIWTTQMVRAEDGTQTLAILMRREDSSGEAAAWSKGGTTPFTLED